MYAYVVCIYRQYVYRARARARVCVCVCVCVYGGETDDEKENNTTFNTAMNDRCNSIASCPTIEINRELRYIRSTPRTFVNFRRIVYLP